MANSKIVLSTGEVLMDLTADTVDATHLLSGITAHGKDGSAITGTCTYDSDTSDDTASASEVLSGKTFHARGAAIEGSMTNRGGVTGTISDASVGYTIPQGYHDGSGKVSIDATSKNLLKPENIRNGVKILNITGTMSEGSTEVKESKTVAPAFTDQTYTPSSGYTCFSQFTVSKIPVVYADNSAGGKTVTIG